jgi:hypothetical protein
MVTCARDVKDIRVTLGVLLLSPFPIPYCTHVLFHIVLMYPYVYIYSPHGAKIQYKCYSSQGIQSQKLGLGFVLLLPRSFFFWTELRLPSFLLLSASHWMSSPRRCLLCCAHARVLCTAPPPPPPWSVPDGMVPDIHPATLTF